MKTITQLKQAATELKEIKIFITSQNIQISDLIHDLKFESVEDIKQNIDHIFSAVFEEFEQLTATKIKNKNTILKALIKI